MLVSMKLSEQAVEAQWLRLGITLQEVMCSSPTDAMGGFLSESLQHQPTCLPPVNVVYFITLSYKVFTSITLSLEIII